MDAAAQGWCLTSRREDLRQLVRRNHLELRERAVARGLVGSPATKLRRVAEAPTLHVVVSHLHDELGTQRLPREILALAPPAECPRLPMRRLRLDLCIRPSLPGMVVEGVLAIRREKIHELLALGRRETGTDADVLEGAVVAVEAKQQRADRRAVAVLVPAEARHDTVAVTLVLHLEHDALVRLVGPAVRLGDHAIEPRALEALEPILGHHAVPRGWRQVQWWRD